MAEVESFTLDHTAVKAPYVRLINVESGPKGDQISNFDVRFVQPNSGEIPTSGLHTIEHLLASLLRDRIDGVIDCSPFGCRTGFHLIMWGTPSVREVTAAIASSLHAIAEEVTWEDVPGTDVYSCGNYRDHSLFSAREWSRTILEQGLSVDPLARAPGVGTPTRGGPAAGRTLAHEFSSSVVSPGDLVGSCGREADAGEAAADPTRRNGSLTR